MNNLSSLLNSFPSVGQLIPATALVAIIIFFIKEYLEARRRNTADARKVRALKVVLARECRLNYAAIRRLSGALELMRDYGVQEDASRVTLSANPAGGFAYLMKDGAGSAQGGVLVGLYREYILKHLVEIAGLDEDLYSKCEKALNGLAEADHVYQSVVHGPEMSFPSTKEDYFDSLIDYGLGELKDSVVALKELYLECTGSELQYGQLR